MTIRAEPVAHFGVELSGPDFSRPLGDDDIVAFRDHFYASKLIVLRGQQLGPDDQLRLSSYVGPVPDAPTFISNVEEAGYHPEVRLLFHSDFAFTPTPLIGISLYCLEVAPGAAATSFVDGTHAAHTLPADLRARIEGRHVMHLADTVTRREDVRRRLVDVGGPDASSSLFPRMTRPVLWPHPTTGEPILYVLEQQASHVEGLDEDDSEALLADLFAHLYAADAVYSHHWEPGDFVLWDNIALQHGRPANPTTVRRSLRRTVISEKTLPEIIAGLGFEQPRTSA
jgi:taurine dioxygenase